MAWRGGFWRPREGAALGLAAFMVGCGGGGGDSGTGPNPPPGELPGPLNVQVTLDSQHADSSQISPAGGVVSASSADGTRFTLRLPENAVTGPQEITLTPVAVIGGLPGTSRLVAAVQLAPEGLSFSV